ncbi:MAG TPA: DNA polymerase/3'-5' exonuclease PolX [Anaerolineae bacterium]|nr:DNA polymerase/3'-5' exonuclease PolX [Anaerolineae bacterium]
MTNLEVAKLLRLIGDMLEIKGEIVYKSLAYRKAADSIESLGRDIEQVWREGKLREIPGVGEALAKKLDELFRTGRLQYLEQLQEEVPTGVVSLLGIPEVGPRTASLLWKKLGAVSVGDVERAAREGRIRNLPGMGVRSEQRILEGIESLYRRSDRIELGVAWPVANELVTELRQALGVTTVEPVGSLRRMRDTIGDIDLLAACPRPAEATAAFVRLEQVQEVLSHGPTRASVLLKNGLQVDLRALEPEHYGSLLQYFTGSKEHNVALRALAQKKGLSLSEYGFKRGDEELLCRTEEEVYGALGLPWIPPELREDRGEIQAAQENRLPRLVCREDIRGDLHAHTDWSDAAATIQEMASAAQALGYEYLVISDHTHSLGVANGLDEARLREQRRAIDALNKHLQGFTVLQGAEVEIRADGSLDFPDEVLRGLDVVIASVHSALRQDRETITERVLRAVRNPLVNVLGHPSGRLLGQREATNLDLDRVIQEAAATGLILEVNATPNRLDLDDAHVRSAIQAGAALAINSDAHSTAGLETMMYGVAAARRGWAEKKDVVNTLPLAQLRQRLRRGERAG